MKNVIREFDYFRQNTKSIKRSQLCQTFMLRILLMIRW